MLIEFSIGNYRSFKDKVTFSMVAANIVAKEREMLKEKDLKLLTLMKLLNYGMYCILNF